MSWFITFFLIPSTETEIEGNSSKLSWGLIREREVICQVRAQRWRLIREGSLFESGSLIDHLRYLKEMAPLVVICKTGNSYLSKPVISSQLRMLLKISVLEEVDLYNITLSLGKILENYQ